MKRARTRSAGMTLLEMVVALAVLAFGMAGVLQVLNSSLQTASLSHRRIAAQALACAKAETLKAAGYEALAGALDQKTEISETDLKLNVGKDPKVDATWRAELSRPESLAHCIEIHSIVEWMSSGQPQGQAQHRVFVFE